MDGREIMFCIVVLVLLTHVVFVLILKFFEFLLLLGVQGTCWGYKDSNVPKNSIFNNIVCPNYLCSNSHLS